MIRTLARYSTTICRFRTLQSPTLQYCFGQQKRNVIIHSMWTPDDADDEYDSQEADFVNLKGDKKDYSVDDEEDIDENAMMAGVDPFIISEIDASSNAAGDENPGFRKVTCIITIYLILL
jgi:hypothetical protein